MTTDNPTIKPDTSNFGIRNVGRPLKYPFNTLTKKGDSFFVPDAGMSLVSSAHSFGKRKGIKLVTATVVNDTGAAPVKGILVSRVE